MKNSLRILVYTKLVTSLVLTAGFITVRAEEQTIHERMLHHRAVDALEYMIEQYHKVLCPEIWEGKKWTFLVPPGSVETSMTYEYANRYDYHSRGVLYYAVISSVKNYGVGTSANYYADLALDKKGEWLDRGKNYRLPVPPDVPARNFWSVTAYDL